MKTTKINAGTYKVVMPNGDVWMVERCDEAHITCRWQAEQCIDCVCNAEYVEQTKAGILWAIQHNYNHKIAVEK